MSSIYSFRSTTVANRNLTPSSTPMKTSRIVLSPSRTGSLYSEKRESLYSENHKCQQIKSDHTYVKTTNRCLFTMFRFYVSYGLACTTTRGQTQMNGAQSGCGGCQAAHAAVTPNLVDNTLNLSRTYLVASPYNQLSPIKQTLVQRCLRLNPSNIETLNDASQTNREQFLKQHKHPSFRWLQSGLFASTSIDFNRNATFEGPTAGNRIDCHLESVLRPIEDTLAQKCSDGKLTPKEALAQFHGQYEITLQNLETRLAQVLPAMQALQQAEEALAKAESALMVSLKAQNEDLPTHLSEYKKNLNHYLMCFNKFLPLGGNGAPKTDHEQIIKGLKEHYPLYLLRNINQTLDKMSFPQLNIHLLAVIRCRAKARELPNWTKMTDEIALRQAETIHQKHILSLGFPAIYELAKMEISSQDETGKWISPTRPAIASTLISRAESPMEPPRKRAKKNTESETSLKSKANLLEKFNETTTKDPHLTEDLESFDLLIPGDPDLLAQPD